MKTLTVILFLVTTFCVNAELPDIRLVEIQEDSVSPLDFRGKPDWKYEPYESLFEATTYGELLVGLENFFIKWREDGSRLKNQAEIRGYYNCKLAAIRLFYLTGQIHEADKLLVELHPGELVKGEEADRLLAANAEKEKIRRVAEELKGVFSDLTDEEMYPNGPPETVHELYRPILTVIGQMSN